MIFHLTHLARTSVMQKTGYDMPAEARYINENGEIIPAHIQAEVTWGNLESDA